MLINWPEKRSSAEHPLLHRGRWNASAAAEAVGNDYFGVISGTANAFATALGIPTTIEAACQTILDGKPVWLMPLTAMANRWFYLVELGLKRLSEPTEQRRTVLACWLAGFRHPQPSFEARVETEDKIVTQASAITIANAAPRLQSWLKDRQNCSLTMACWMSP